MAAAKNPTSRKYAMPNVECEIIYELCKEAEVVQKNTAKLIPLIDPSLMCPFLQCLTPDDRQCIAAKMNTDGPFRAVVLLLDRLVKREKFWDDFLDVLKNENIGLGYIARDLEKDMQQYLEEKKQDNMDAEKTETSMTCESVFDVEDGEPKAKVRKVQEEPSTSQPREGAQQANSSTNLVSEINKEVVVQTKNFSKLRIECLEFPKTMMKPRKYQIALADLAQKGHNTIIRAPTGSGKTFVASLICGNHLQKKYAKIKQNWDENEKKMVKKVIEESEDVKIVVIVPTHPILMQWYRAFKTTFPTYHIAKRSGSEQQSNVPLNIKLKINDVVIVTAELFLNTLVDEIVELSTVTLLIFDECHRTMDKHPFNMIMAEYRRVKIQGLNTKLPQIVGLSASPAAGKKTTYDSAEKRIWNLCANLDSEYVVSVPEELQEELEIHAPKSTKSNKIIVGRRIDDPFTSQLYSTMASLEKFAKMRRINDLERGRPEYRAKIEKELEDARDEDSALKRKCGEHLLEYNKVLELIDYVQLKDGLKLLDTFYSSLKKRKADGSVDNTEEFLLKSFTDVAEQLQRYSENENEYPNPKLQELRSGLVEYIGECKQRKEEFRGIIFVSTKLLAEALREFLFEDPELSDTNPRIVISANRSVDGAMTKSEQDDTLENFRVGKVKLLISTSILDEGVDIEACNMTVNYGRLTNAITMVQSRGRARNENSAELVIGEKEVVERNTVNLILIEQMDKAITDIQQSQKDNQQSYKEKLAGIQRRDVSSRQTKKQETTLLQNSNSAEDVEFRCKGCELIVCKASDMRVIDGSSYVNPSPQFKEKVIFQEHNKEASREQGIQKIYCVKCKYDWGNTADGHPCLKMKSFSILVKGKVKKVKQWKHIPCKIQRYDGCTHMDT